jgi:hypothetical protein
MPSKAWVRQKAMTELMNVALFAEDDVIREKVFPPASQPPTEM